MVTVLQDKYPKVHKSLFGKGNPKPEAWIDAYRQTDNHGVTNQNWAEIYNHLLMFARSQHHLGASAHAALFYSYCLTCWEKDMLKQVRRTAEIQWMLLELRLRADFVLVWYDDIIVHCGVVTLLVAC